MTSPPVSKPLGPLADRASAGLAACCIATLGLAWAHLNEAAAFDRLFGGTETVGGAQYADDLYTVAIRLALAANVVTGVLFIAWFRRCYRNLEARHISLPYSAKETVWAWVVPIASLFRPAQIARAMWTATGDGRDSAGPVARWWALFVCSGVITTVIFEIGSGDSTSNKAGLHRALAGLSLVSIAAAIAAIAFVHQLTARIDAGENEASSPPVESVGA